MRNKLLILLAVGVVGIALLYGLPYLQRPDIDSLVEKALNASSDSEKIEAAQKLSLLGEQGLEGIRQVLKNSDNNDVVAISVLAISRQMDYTCMNQILTKLDDPSANIRMAAANAVTKLLGRDHHFPATGTIDQRTEIRNQIIEDWNAYKGSELFEFNKNRFNNQN